MMSKAGVGVDRYEVRRLVHRLKKYRAMMDVLAILRHREELHYGEVAQVLEVSPAYAYGLLDMLARMCRLPFRDGIMDNPGDDRLMEATWKIKEWMEKTKKTLEEKRKQKKKKGKRCEKRKETMTT
jgi:hypothetical protein